ncbi:UPF0175 family protein [uncultured Thiodictyon sp.]|uniref:UPF0175 family protein n=1 Tax=uncultured Thiodictyon sp. TaxID=1846217 RepID=UPI0025D5E8B2|nr:UPF0175 family protein [uncultured Thiodictyon sp.]
MTQLTLDIPESAFSTLHQAPAEFAQEMRVAAAVKWYELERISQGRAAEIAGLTPGYDAWGLACRGGGWV